MPGDPVLVEVKDRIGQITLNRPENRNSMDYEVLPAFREAIFNLKSDRDLRCVIITGSGKSFCSGADFKSSMSVENDKRMPQEVVMDFYRPFLDIQEFEIPTIAAMNGHAIGGGFGLALICDIRIANKNSKYGANFTRLGLHSGMAISYMLPRIVGLPVANELLYTGRLINGDEAANIGLANYSMEDNKVLDKSWELAREIEACAPAAVRMIKSSIYRGLDWNPTKAAEYESHCQSRTFEMEDAKEGIRALLEKRSPNFQGQ
ncbi:MAG: enoyl-CoA hydratase/isomerase family protein [Spirochaetota bacterium]|nr:enoyl-CoA hydratase/isomerase family protein [Spirochaetota bacterium]